MFNFMTNKNSKGKAKYKTFQVRNIPNSLWTQFKVICTQNGVSMNQKILQILEDYTKGKPFV